MILAEMDPILARSELIPKLQDIMTAAENNDITREQAIIQIKEIQKDLIVRISLSSPSPKELFEWNFLRLTVSNLLEFLDDK